MSISHLGNQLFIHDLVITFPRDIYKILIVQDGVIILTHGLQIQEYDERNVLFVKMDGSIKWQIQHFGEPNADIGYQGYISMEFDEDNILLVHTYRGFCCTVDIETGKLIDCDFGTEL